MRFDTRAQALEEILEHIARIEQFVANVDEGQFRNDARTVFAVHDAVSVISAVAVALATGPRCSVPMCPGTTFGIWALGFVLGMTASIRPSCGARS